VSLMVFHYIKQTDNIPAFFFSPRINFHFWSDQIQILFLIGGLRKSMESVWKVQQGSRNKISFRYCNKL